jgi:hypothetical protein
MATITAKAVASPSPPARLGPNYIDLTQLDFTLPPDVWVVEGLSTVEHVNGVFRLKFRNEYGQEWGVNTGNIANVATFSEVWRDVPSGTHRLSLQGKFISRPEIYSALVWEQVIRTMAWSD